MCVTGVGVARVWEEHGDDTGQFIILLGFKL
jgi:hypothetical protein